MIAIPIMLAIVLIAAQDAHMQSLSNQPYVTIMEGKPYIQRSCPFMNLNVSVAGYLDIRNPSETTTLYSVDINYDPFPPEVAFSEAGASIFNSSGGPFAVPGHNLGQPGVIHINEIPPGTTYRINYWINTTPVDDIRYLGFPAILTAGESVYEGDPATGLRQLTIRIDWRTLEYYVEEPVDSSKKFTIAIYLYNTGQSDLSNLRFYKQLPAGDLAGESYVWFDVSDASYESSAGSIPLTHFAPGPTNAVDIGITGGAGVLRPGEKLEILITGRFAQRYSAGGDPQYYFVSLRPAYFNFTAALPGASFLGSRIRNGTPGWLIAGGDAGTTLEKYYDNAAGKWTFSVGAYNPGDISYTDLDLDVYRNSAGSLPDYQIARQAGPIYSLTPPVILGPSGAFDTGAIADAGYNGTLVQPPVYWLAANITLNGSYVGRPPHYTQGIIIAADCPGSVSLPEPHMRITPPGPYPTATPAPSCTPAPLPADAGLLLPGHNPWLTVNANDTRMGDALAGALNNTGADSETGIVRADADASTAGGEGTPATRDDNLAPVAIAATMAISAIFMVWLLAVFRIKRP